MEAGKCVGGLLVLFLMIYYVSCYISVTCVKDRPNKGSSETCYCQSDTGKDITWNKNGQFIANCIPSPGTCLPPSATYDFSTSVSGSMNVFSIKMKSFQYSSCGNYTCTDGNETATPIPLVISAFNSSLIENEPPDGEAGNITITTGCSFRRSDFDVTWKLNIETDWRDYELEVIKISSDSTNCTETCGTAKAEQITATLEHGSHERYRKAKVGLTLVHKHLSDNNLLFWQSTKIYKLKNCCINDGDDFLGICIAALIVLSGGLIFFVIVLIIVGQHGEVVVWNLSRLDIAAAALNVVGILYSLIVGPYTVHKNGDCRNCTTCFYQTCNHCLYLGIASIVLACVNVVVLIVFIIIRQGWFGKHLTCLNTVLPVCKDTEARGPPDGKSDNPAAKEKHREVKLLTHKEQTHKETVVKKGKLSGENHEELSKGQPRPLPVPTGNNRDDTGSAGAVSRQDVVLDRRPMPEIPSDRHKRGLSANFNDDRDKPLDDNILHTLPVVKKPKNALDPMNAEDQSKNADDQPKKKKKKKKDRDTSRSEEMEDDIDSHGKVLAF